MCESRVNLYKLGFSLCTGSGLILLSTHHLIDGSYTCSTAIDCVPKIIIGIVLSILTIAFTSFAVLAFENTEAVKNDNYKDEHRTNLVAAELEHAASQSLKTSKIKS